MSKFLILEEKPNNKKEFLGNKIEDFEMLQKLGEGSFGYVEKVKSKINKKIYALKKIDFNKIKEQEQIDLCKKEIEILRTTKGPYLIEFYDTFFQDDSLYIITEFMDNGDLKGYYNVYKDNNMQIPENELWKIFYQCISGLNFLHRKNLIHRDIKPANIFMTNEKNIKFGDFGATATKEEILNDNIFVGTVPYTAPEIILDKEFGLNVDVYSLGVTFYELCYFNLPKKIEKILDQNGNQVPWWTENKFFTNHYYSPEMNNLISLMIEVDNNKRISSSEALEYVIEVMSKTQKIDYDNIDNVYRCLYAYKNLTEYMTLNYSLNINTNEKPIIGSFILAISSIDKMDKELWKNIKKSLVFENPFFPDFEPIDTYDLI